MASKQDKISLRDGNDVSQMDFNNSVATSQRDKNIFRAHKVAMNADPYNPARLDNAVQQKLLDE